jgi:hypothetical protein
VPRTEFRHRHPRTLTRHSDHQSGTPLLKNEPAKPTTLTHAGGRTPPPRHVHPHHPAAQSASSYDRGATRSSVDQNPHGLVPPTPDIEDVQHDHHDHPPAVSVPGADPRPLTSPATPADDKRHPLMLARHQHQPQHAAGPRAADVRQAIAGSGHRANGSRCQSLAAARRRAATAARNAPGGHAGRARR